MIKPNLFLLGAPKCGTTSMIHYLSQHQDIFVSAEKEPHYFNLDSTHRYYFNEQDYLSLFEKSGDNLYRCEGSVWYLYSKVAAQNILDFNPEAKFIVMLRNPVEMYYSLHQELLYGGSENVKSPVDAWELQQTRLTGSQIPLGCSDSRFLQYGEACKLGQQLQNLYDVVPKEKVTVVFIDDMKSDISAVYNRILSFLDLKDADRIDFEIRNKKKVRKSYLLFYFFKVVQSIKTKLNLKKGLGLANWINSKNMTEGKDLEIEFDKENLNKKLSKYFQEDIKLIESLTGKKLSHWL